MTFPTEEKPLPCPFCGAHLIRSEWSGMAQWNHPPAPDWCHGMTGGAIIGRGVFTSGEAITAWNRRSPSRRSVLEEAAREIERYSEGLIPDYQVVCEWLAARMRALAEEN